MEVLSEHNCQGWLEGYLLTGRSWPLRDVRGLRHGVGVDDRPRHAKVAHRSQPARLAPRRWPRSTSCSPPRAGATITMASVTRGPGSSTWSSRRKATVGRESTCPRTPIVCCRSRITASGAGTTSNLIVIDKQAAAPVARYGGGAGALRGVAHRSGGGRASEGTAASRNVILGRRAGDIPTVEVGGGRPGGCAVTPPR